MTDHHALPILVRVGKAGITDSIIGEIKKHVKKRKMVKVKFLPAHASGKDKRQFAKELAEKTGTKTIHQVGFVVVLGQNAETLVQS
jgi:RNA-binding protein YhbY